MGRIVHVLAGLLLMAGVAACSDDAGASGGASSSSTHPLLAGVSYRDIISVPGGTFSQVSCFGEVFNHTITSFRMGKYEVTYELWFKVYTWAITNGFVFANAGVEGHVGTTGSVPTTAKYEPVTGVNWRDVMVWCNAWSRMEKLQPVYCSDSAGLTPIKDSSDGSYSNSMNATAGSSDAPFVSPDANGYRLPTEGQWQYAASYRDGSAWTPHAWASGATADYSNTAACSAVAVYNCSAIQAVGTKTANALGIHDMSGNAWEWVFDLYGVLPTTAQTDYGGPASGNCRIFRGGTWQGAADKLQVGDRGICYPFFEGEASGFRVSRSVTPGQ